MKKLTDYYTEFVFRHDEPEEADFIMIPGNGHGELSIEAARLYRLGYAKTILVSGRFSKLLPTFAGPISPESYIGKVYQTEADFHSHVLMDHGVPEDAIIKEEEATFTYENALYLRKLLQEKGLYSIDNAYKVILVCQAFHAKRSLMYFQHVFPNVTFLCCPAVTQGISADNWFETEKGRNIVLGEVSRCGSQLTDILNGTDTIWKEILND